MRSSSIKNSSLFYMLKQSQNCDESSTMKLLCISWQAYANDLLLFALDKGIILKSNPAKCFYREQIWDWESQIIVMYNFRKWDHPHFWEITCHPLIENYNPQFWMVIGQPSIENYLKCS